MGIILLLILPLVSSKVHVVKCPDGQSHCSCDTSATVCEFTLKIEERQSFTSYKFNQQDLSFEGESYYLNGTGYIPTVAQDADCNIKNPTPVTPGDFTSRGCSVPVTLDGISYRSIITINGQFPGPTLIATTGQTVKFRVYNRLMSQSVSIHWHGLFQRDTPWMDGVAFVTQPPIDPGSSFDYIFKVQQSGSYWYHSHIGLQRSDGLFGGLILRDPVNFFEQTVRPRVLPEDSNTELVDSPENHTITVLDWMREHPIDQFIPSNDSLFLYPADPINTVPTRASRPHDESELIDGTGTSAVPYGSGLINGKGHYNSSTLAPLTVISVESNRYYRFRLIGTSALLAFNFSIDGHMLRAIASDGNYFEPQDVQYIVVHSGERYDFILNTTNNGGQTNYWIRAETLIAGEPHRPALAILSYSNGKDIDWMNGYSNVPDDPHKCSTANPCRVLNCPFPDYPTDTPLTCVSLLNLSALFPLPHKELPKFPPTSGCSDCIHFLNFGYEGPNDDGFINARSLEFPDTAYATNCAQYTSTQSDINTCDKCTVTSNSTGCKCIHVIPLVNSATYTSGAQEYETVVFIFSSLNSADTHPIHMHGHAYHIIHIGYGIYNETTGRVISPSNDLTCDTVGGACVIPKWTNGTPPADLYNRIKNGRVLSSAIMKDTVMVPGYGYVVVAIQANNPGYWFLHCHIEFHLAMGMAAILQEYDPLQHKAPPSDINNHGSFQLSVEQFQSFQDDASTCEDVLQPHSNNDIVIRVSREVFGIIIGIIIVIILIIIIGYIITCVCCYKRRRNGYSPINN